MKKTLISLALILAATTSFAAKPQKKAGSVPYSFLAAIDAEGKYVGFFVNASLFHKVPSHSIPIKLEMNFSSTHTPAMYAPLRGSVVLFEFPDCVSDPYIDLRWDDNSWPLRYGFGGFEYSYPDMNAEPQALYIASHLNRAGECINSSSSGLYEELVPAIPYDLDITPPIRMEIR